MPTNTGAAPDSSSPVKKNPIHKQDLKTDGGDWFPERGVSACTSPSVCVCVKERRRGTDRAGGRRGREKTGYIPVRVTQKASKQMLE